MQKQLSKAIRLALAQLCLVLMIPQSMGEVLLQNKLCAVTLDPATLELNWHKGSQPALLLSAAQTNLGKVVALERSENRVSWSLPERKVSISLELLNDRLSAHVLSTEAGEFTFPILSEAAAVRGWILPLFEGVYAPVGDNRWRRFLVNQGELNSTADMGLPFLGLDCGDFTLTCILTNPFNNHLKFQQVPKRHLQLRVMHEFTRNHPVKEHGVVFMLGTNSPIEPARSYRLWLKERGEFLSLREKTRLTPEAAELPGAAHIYLWGTELLSVTDVHDWRKFARDLKTNGEAESPSPARRIWCLMKPAAKESVGTVAKAEWPDKYTKSQITVELNRLLLQATLYEKSSWQGVELDEETTALLRTNHTIWSKAEICQVNSRLFAAAFPGLLAKPESWGNGVSPKMVQRLVEAGLDRLWLGSDGWEAFLNRPETVAAAKKAGFLIGPYDSFHSIHRPNEPDTWPTAQFGKEAFESGAIVNADGTRRRGFKGKGFLFSPAAARPLVEKRVSELMSAFHANSWFIDCDGFGEYFDDYSEQHPATQQSDLAARNSRMRWIRDSYGAVIGTEGCSAGVASTVHFAHGVLTPVIGWSDPDLKDKKSRYYLGAYYPPEAPQVFFKPVPTKEVYRDIYFNPAVRLPLFEAVFHDSVIATHHWSFASLKTSDQAGTVELLELLYNVPPLYHLNLDELEKRKRQIKTHFEFFSPLHHQTAFLPLTDFQWLTDDHMVQRTLFGDQIQMVANFGMVEFVTDGTVIPKRSVMAKWLKSGRSATYAIAESN